MGHHVKSKNAMLQSPNPVAWVIVLAVIAATDFVWFAFTGNGVYELKNKVKSSHRELKAPVAVLSCAAFASLVLCSFASDGYGEAALTGAAIGGLVFFVFNVCLVHPRGKAALGPCWGRLCVRHDAVHARFDARPLPLGGALDRGHAEQHQAPDYARDQNVRQRRKATPALVDVP